MPVRRQDPSGVAQPFPAQGYSDPIPPPSLRPPFEGLWMEAPARDQTQALTAEQGLGGAGRELQKEPQGAAVSFGQHQRPQTQGLGQPGLCQSGLLPGRLPPTLGLSNFYFNQRLVKRGLSEYEPGSANPLLKTHSPWRQGQAPRQGHIPSSVPATGYALCQEPPAHMCTGQRLSGAGFTAKWV